MKEIWYGRLIPQELTILLIVVVGFLIMFQKKKMALSIFLLVMGSLFTPLFMHYSKPFFKESFLLLKTLILNMPIMHIIIFFILATAIIIRIIVGKEVWLQLKANLIYELLKFIFLLPFRIIKFAIKQLYDIKQKQKERGK